jgi:uncharacterized YccA/Bax inhibitor family protein
MAFQKHLYTGKNYTLLIKMMRTANPALNKNTFVNFTSETSEHMTINGTVNKSFIMMILLLVTAFYSWNIFLSGELGSNMGIFYLGLFGGLIVAIITIYKKQWAPYTAPLYALLEGLVLGFISSLMESYFPGIVIQAVALTFGTLLVLLFAYRSGIIKATENFKLGVAAATGAIFLIYMVTLILGFFGTTIPYIHQSGTIGILFSLFVVVIAALNLVLDFDFIEQGAEKKVPKYMEWYAAFGLMVTLIWLYLEILRLLAKMRSRN